MAQILGRAQDVSRNRSEFFGYLEFSKEKPSRGAQCLSPVPRGWVSVCGKRAAGTVVLPVPRVSLNAGLICPNFNTKICFEARTWLFPLETAPTA